MTEQILIGIIGIAAGALLVYVLIGKRNKPSLGENEAQFQNMIAQHIQHLSKQLDNRLREHTEAVNESKEFLANRVSAAERTVRTVHAGLGKLEQATGQLQRTSDEIVSFQSMLRSPKVRGSFGEVLLSNLLSEVLPEGRYELQYPISGSGEIVDAIIRLQDGHIVAIDAKFPLANFEVYRNEEDEERKDRARREFIRDVKKHITDISKKYIVPGQQTLDYAFMYIPLEGVYYETMMQSVGDENLWEFSRRHHVIPTSPNNFLAYLETVLIGLRGMKVEQQAREILQHLSQLRRDFGTFADEFSTVGTHLTNAKNRFDDSARRLDKLGNRLEQIDTSSSEKQLPPN